MHGVFGKTSVLGQMPDWNPAEMIGRAPRALSFSLYRTLITDDAWRIARKKMGYAVPDGQRLMVSLAGQPFIDTRLSFHSYLPKNLPSNIAEKLVNNWTESLIKNPHLHDKIEFEIAITTFSFDIRQRLSKLNCFSNQEIEIIYNSFRELTLPLIIGKSNGSINSALDQINKLNCLKLPKKDSGIPGLLYLIEKCRELGTIPFSILARHGFIAKTILLSLVHCGMISEKDLDDFQSGIETIATEFRNEISLFQSGKISYESFMNKFGHLRPGTYDILSKRYDQMEDFDNFDLDKNIKEIKNKEFNFSEKQLSNIDKLLNKEKLNGINSKQLFQYCSTAISAREYGKFVFTKSVSTMLELIASYGEIYGLNRDEMSHIPLQVITSCSVESNSLANEIMLKNTAKKNKKRHETTVSIRLPQILHDVAGAYIVPFQVSQPNFITNKKVSAQSIYINRNTKISEIDNKIVLIENADPGYDWIFSRSILALVTKYGGANSHMAIRCAEFGIPAAIGCGEQRFDNLMNADKICINCEVGLIGPLH